MRQNAKYSRNIIETMFFQKETHIAQMHEGGGTGDNRMQGVCPHTMGFPFQRASAREL